MDRDPLDSVTALGDPTRRRLYDHVSAQGRFVARDEAARAAGIGRTLAAYHLDRLAEAGLLDVSYERRSGRSGPGAGRPAKLYGRAVREVAVSLPPRDYGIAARLLADAAATDTDGTTRRALAAAAARLGRDLAAEAAEPPGDREPPPDREPPGEPEPPGDLERLLRERGYEPFREGADPTLRMRNCPFHAVAQRHPEIVCEMNLALLRGVLEGLGAPPGTAVLEPAPGRCCVAITPRAGSRSA